MKKLNLLFLVLCLALQGAFTKSTGSDPPIEDSESATEIYTNSGLINQNNGSHKESANEMDSEFIFRNALDGDWKNADVLIEFARLTNNNKLKLIIYNVLWHEIKTTKTINNPFSTITVVVSLQKDLQNLKTPLTSSEEEQFANMQHEMRAPLTTSCAKKLEAVFYVNGSFNCFNFPVLERLLVQMQPLGESIFAETINKIYEGVEDLVTSTQIAKALKKFSPNTEQNVVAILKILNRTSTKADSAVMDELKQHLQYLTFKNDFATIPDHLKEQINDLVPKKFGVLDTLEKVCFRNAKNNEYMRYYNYNYNGYLSTLSGKDSYSIYQVQHGKDDRIAFLNQFHNKYIALEKGIKHSLPHIIEEVYFSSEPEFWHIQSNLDGSVSLIDSTRNYYLCSGSSEIKYNGHLKIYGRIFNDFLEYTHECQWIAEDCA